MLNKSFGVRFLALAAILTLFAACAQQGAGPSSSQPPAGESTTSTGAAPAMPAEPAQKVEEEKIVGPAAGSAGDFIATAGGDRVFFAFDRFDLSTAARTALQRQAKWLQRYRNVSFIIEGHCDERGTREYNLALGERRANAVKNYLVALGVSASRIGIISYGKERPADPRSNEEAWAKNRRGVTVIG